MFASKLGWDVTSIDISNEGKRKTFQLAKEQNVSIKYVVDDIETVNLPNESYDTIALIFAHFSSWKISKIHKKLIKLLKEDGIIIFEAYSKNHLSYKKNNPKVGGPDDLDMLFSIEQIKADFKGLEIQLLEEKEITLKEGKFHNGIGSVIRFVGKKTN